MGAFEKEVSTIPQRFRERRILLEPFIKLYGKPVLVHAIHNLKIFEKVLKDAKLKLPKNHTSIKKTPYLEKLLKINDCIYYSLGFAYLTAYGLKYNLIFDLNYLKELTYYETSLNYHCYKAIVDYWYKHDKGYLEKLANTNNRCREVVDKYYNKTYNGQKRSLFDFWKIEKIVFEHIQKYPHKQELMKIINYTGRKFLKKYPASFRDAKKAYLTKKTPEMVGKKENNLLKNPYFLGFYVKGNIPRKIKLILRKKYPSKILFDGKKIIPINCLE